MRQPRKLCHLATIAAVLVVTVACDKPKATPDRGDVASAAVSAVGLAAPAPAPDLELAWTEIRPLIEREGLSWVVPAMHRRFFLTTGKGNEVVTTAPADDSIDKLITELKLPSGTVCIAPSYEPFEEVRWADLPARLRGREVFHVHQNRKRRLILWVTNAEGHVSDRFITIQPHHDDILALVPKKHPSGLFTKIFDYEEIPWGAFLDRIRAEPPVSTSLLHGRRVIARTKAGHHLLTIEPSNDAMRVLIERDKLDVGSVTVE